MPICTLIETIDMYNMEPSFSMSDVSEPDCRVFRSATHQSGLGVSGAGSPTTPVQPGTGKRQLQEVLGL